MREWQKNLLICYYFFKYRYFSNFKNKNSLIHWQKRKFKKHLRWIVKNSPYYRDLLNGNSDVSLTDIPVINKSELMKNFDRINTVGLKKKNVFSKIKKAEQTRNFKELTVDDIAFGASSGTSGRPVIFLASSSERARYIGTIMGKAKQNHLFWKNRLALVLRSNNPIYDTKSKKRHQFKYFDPTTSLDKIVEDLNSYNPTVLFAPPSMLLQLAKEAKQGELKINPREITSVAEVLTLEDKKNIEDSFNIKLHEYYQTAEGHIGMTHLDHEIYLNEDLIIIEKDYIDKKSERFVPIITDLYRKSLPLIRYRLDDILVEDVDNLDNVFTRLKQIDGRCDDVIYLKSKESDSLVPLYPDFFRRNIIFCNDNINDYLLEETTSGVFELTLEAENIQSFKEIKTDVLASLEKLSQKFEVILPEVRLNFEKIPINFDKKKRRIISKRRQQY